MATTQERYYELLLERIRQDNYPSPQLLDRAEAAYCTAKQFHTYVELLLDKTGQSRYMSPQLLDRIQRLLAVAAAA